MSTSLRPSSSACKGSSKVRSWQSCVARRQTLPYLVLDACRDTLQGARGGKGFMPVGQQSGIPVAFAAEPGKTASDIGQGSGPYAAVLATELMKPAQNDLLMFHNVRMAVMDRTNGDQVPWTEDGIQRRQRVLFGGEAKAAPLSQPAPMRLSEGGRGMGRNQRFDYHRSVGGIHRPV
jgi:uncharacterized caspase-like protein